MNPAWRCALGPICESKSSMVGLGLHGICALSIEKSYRPRGGRLNANLRLLASPAMPQEQRKSRSGVTLNPSATTPTAGTEQPQSIHVSAGRQEHVVTARGRGPLRSIGLRMSAQRVSLHWESLKEPPGGL